MRQKVYVLFQKVMLISRRSQEGSLLRVDIAGLINLSFISELFKAALCLALIIQFCDELLMKKEEFV